MSRRVLLQLFAGDAGQAPGAGQDNANVEPADSGAAPRDGAAGDAQGGDAPDDQQGGQLDPKVLEAELKRARDEAAKYRRRQKEWQEQLQQLQEAVAKALGLKTDDEIQAEKITAELEAFKRKYREERLRNAFYRHAEALQADAELAYAVLKASEDLDDIDVDDPDFENILRGRLEALLERHPKLRREPAVQVTPPASGADFTAKDQGDAKPKDLGGAIAAYYQRLMGRKGG